MKISKYLFKPVKFIIILAMFAALIYFRSIIFHSNVNKPVDVAMSYIETKFDIKIPAHVEAADAKDVNVMAQKEQPLIEIEMVEANNDSEIAKPIVNAEIVDVDTKEIAEEVTSDSILDSTTDSFLTERKINVIDDLTKAVNIINQKIDMLFERGNEESAASESSAAKDMPVAEMQSDAKDAQIPDVDKQALDVSKDSATSDAHNILFMARQSFWNGNTSLSEKFYIDLSKDEDATPDVYGELGNVYYAQGKWKQAGEAYYEAAIRLLELKQNDQVSYLLRVIQGLDASSADKLRQKISG